MKFYTNKLKITAIGLVIVISLITAAVTTLNVSGARAETATGPEIYNILKTVGELEEKAEKGDALSQFKLGYYYYTGMLVGKDLGKAVMWLTLAHEQGDLAASNLLGEIYLNQGTEPATKKSFEFFKASADGGYKLGQLNLGVMYYRGDGVKQDYSKASTLFLAASKQDLPIADFYIGIMYENAQGTERNLVKALYWYESAANKGNSRGAIKSGGYHYYGYGTVINMEESFKYYKMAAELGDKVGRFILGTMYRFGQGTPRDLELAYTWLVVAQVGGYKQAEKQVKALVLKLTNDQLRSAHQRIDSILNSNITQSWI